ncbi:hypothetical protein [Jeotgalibacillus proteolyticus]|uniref:Uncharacterized protein n=1 Tax=Jeotgalibacillus proteolyticus TaxID=2082395 RepID=A0A2S5GAI0_9BACL|nr:hypothetical protein [Jeotgalibacillus proteolyticus]PPA70008.1 hypothetical protein C4B60_10435 [Jeotgalibacillus proteolyticus]
MPNYPVWSRSGYNQRFFGAPFIVAPFLGGLLGGALGSALVRPPIYGGYPPYPPPYFPPGGYPYPGYGPYPYR